MGEGFDPKPPSVNPVCSIRVQPGSSLHDGRKDLYFPAGTALPAS